LTYIIRLIGAVVVTVPSLAYILQKSEEHDPGEHHTYQGEPNESAKKSAEVEKKLESSKGAAEEHEDGDGDDENEDEDAAQESKKDGPEEEKSSEDDDDDGKQEDDGDVKTADPPESKGNVEGVRFKGPSSKGGDDDAAPDTRIIYPDAKGGKKKRIQSDYAHPVGKSGAEREGETGSTKDKVCLS
jgi:hypothetical protein